MKTRALIFTAFFALLSLASSGQLYYGGFSGSYNYPRTSFMADSTGNIFFQPGDIGFSMSAGAGFGSFSRGGSYFTTYASPAIAYNVSKRFRLKAGVTLYNQSGNILLRGEGRSPSMSPYTGTSLFVQGDYILSNKFMISGAFYKDFDAFNAVVSNPGLKAQESQGVILNLNFRPAPGFEINAGVEFSNGYNPYRHSPFYQPSPFAPGFPW